MHRIWQFVAPSMILCLLGAFSPVRGQVQSGGSAGGMTSSFGSGSFGGGTGGSTGFGSGSFGGSGQGGLGTGSSMGSGFGGGASGGVSQDGGFVGRDSADVTAMFESMSMRGQALMDRAEGVINRSERGSQLNQQQSAPPIRVRLNVGFDYPSPEITGHAQEFDARRVRAFHKANFDTVDHVRQGREIVLTGAVATEWDRLVAEKLASLEPGVSRVRNQIAVAEAIDAPSRED